jgi:hypothetical protein
LALAQEVAKLHHNLILETPEKLRTGLLWQLNDQDGELTARSSRALEAFLITAIDRTFVKHGSVKLLEIGCGSASYIKYAAEKNSSLHAARVGWVEERNPAKSCCIASCIMNKAGKLVSWIHLNPQD